MNYLWKKYQLLIGSLLISRRNVVISNHQHHHFGWSFVPSHIFSSPSQFIFLFLICSVFSSWRFFFRLLTSSLRLFCSCTIICFKTDVKFSPLLLERRLWLPWTIRRNGLSAWVDAWAAADGVVVGELAISSDAFYSSLKLELSLLLLMDSYGSCVRYYHYHKPASLVKIGNIVQLPAMEGLLFTARIFQTHPVLWNSSQTFAWTSQCMHTYCNATFFFKRWLIIGWTVRRVWAQGAARE